MNPIDEHYRDAALRTRHEVESVELPPFDPSGGHSTGTKTTFVAAVVLLVTILGVAAVANLTVADDSIGTLGSEDDPDTVEDHVPPPVGVGLPVTAEPYRDLVDGQRITITGSGFPANTTVGLVMCSAHLAPAEGIDRCTPSTFNSVSTDYEGNVSAAFTVRRIIEVDGRPIDCASDPPDDTPSSCSVAVGVLDDYSVHGSVSLHFDRDGPVQPHSALSVSQTEDLVDFQPVTVTITDPGVESVWYINQCVVGQAPPLCAGAAIDAGDGPTGWTQAVSSPDGGAIAVELRVRRMVDDVDCAGSPEACSVIVENPDTATLHSGRISFQPDSPLAEVSLVELSAEPMPHASHLLLEIVGRSPSQLSEPLWQCPAGVEGLEDCQMMGEATGLSPRGATASVFMWHELLPGSGGPAIDCTVDDACVVRLVDAEGAILAEVAHTVVVAAEDQVENPDAPSPTHLPQPSPTEVTEP